MKLKDYGKTHNKRKQLVSQPDILLIGIDVSKANMMRVLRKPINTLHSKMTRQGFRISNRY